MKERKKNLEVFFIFFYYFIHGAWFPHLTLLRCTQTMNKVFKYFLDQEVLLNFSYMHRRLKLRFV